MSQKQLTPNVSLIEQDWTSVMTAKASKEVFLNGGYLLEILNNKSILAKVSARSKTDHSFARHALEDTIHPKYIASGHYNNEVHYETEDERAMKLWPDNEVAREAFKLGCKFPKEQSDAWKTGYDTIKKKSAREHCDTWAKQQEDDIAMLEALTPEERLDILIERAAQAARWNKESVERSNSSW